MQWRHGAGPVSHAPSSHSAPSAATQVRKRKWVSYSSGEELFGLPITQYPELERTEEEIVMLDKLYRCGCWAWGGGRGGMVRQRQLHAPCFVLPTTGLSVLPPPCRTTHTPAHTHECTLSRTLHPALVPVRAACT